ncbi:MAG TPA: serine/threonine-protein kinase [Thermoanaerobaculia bacterium]|nr:serine/threonine-protein kinase [Thermoanaerobaculia bacterium]
MTDGSEADLAPLAGEVTQLLEAARRGEVSELASLSDWIRVGSGGMAAVYRASTAGGEPVAVKMLHQVDLSPAGERRFARECEIIQRLDHPNIVRQLGAARSPSDRRFLIMQFVEGETLARRLAEGRLRLDEALPLLRQLAAALDHAHERGVVHRDVKPANVLLEIRDGAAPRVVLTDFGIAKVEGGTLLTGGNVMGTVAYMAPEQVRGAHEVDHRANVYALGVVAYEMLTGSHPFPGRTMTAVLLAHLQRPPADPRLAAPELPSTVARALLRALRKEPDKRPQSAGAFVVELIAGSALDDTVAERTLGPSDALDRGARGAVAAPT